jgi:hypothetical protein
MDSTFNVSESLNCFDNLCRHPGYNCVSRNITGYNCIRRNHRVFSDGISCNLTQLLSHHIYISGGVYSGSQSEGKRYNFINL